MTVFLSYAILLSIVTEISVLFLRFFALAFIYNTPEEMFIGGFAINMAVSVVLLVVVLIIAWFFCRPFDQTLKKIKLENYSPTEDEIKKCLDTYRKLNILTISANFIGFFVGQVYMVWDGIHAGRAEYILVRAVLIVAQAVAFGGISCMSTINGLDALLAKPRQYLKIQSVDNLKKYRSMTLTSILTMTFFITLTFMAVNMICTLYGSFAVPDEGVWMKKGVLCFILSMLLAGYPFLVIIFGLTKRMRHASEVMEEISKEGDLQHRIDITVLDDFGVLTTSINQMIDKLSTMIRGLIDSTDTVSYSAKIINASVFNASTAIDDFSNSLEKINANSEEQNNLVLEADKNISSLAKAVKNIREHLVEQSDSVATISSSVTQMTANIGSVAETAEKARASAEVLTLKSQEGRASIENAIATMEAIQKSSAEVQEFVAIIKNLASQTNLLSMNAAIEAAHAGQFGAGFAVVAEEVRNLAESSAKSARNIQQHIEEMIVTIDNGVETINSAGQSFNEISQKVEETANFVGEISAAMEEQKIGAAETQQATITVVDAVHAVNELAATQTEDAQKVREFMRTVVQASESTLKAVQDGVIATMHLKESVHEVNDSATSNTQSVDVIEQQVGMFKL
ncbi:MAG: HAMP domain-containing protein [Treponema sp.]|nr:HAMP domain-containing protein [Treponema sp.]